MDEKDLLAALHSQDTARLVILTFLTLLALDVSLHWSLARFSTFWA